MFDRNELRTWVAIAVAVGAMAGTTEAADDRCVYSIGRDSGTIRVYEPTSLELVREIETGEAALDLALDPDREEVYVASSRGVRSFSASGGSERWVVIGRIERVAVGDAGISASLSASRTNVAIGGPNNRLRTVGMGQAPAAAVFSLDGSELYVAVAGAGAVRVVDLERGAVIESIELGDDRYPESMAISPDGRSLFVGSFGADPEAGIVHVIDRKSRRPVAEVAVGGGPRGIVFTEDGRFALVSNTRLAVRGRPDQMASETIALIDTKTLTAEMIPLAEFGHSPSDVALHGTHAFVAVDSKADTATGAPPKSSILQIDLLQTSVSRQLELPEAIAAMAVGPGSCSAQDETENDETESDETENDETKNDEAENEVDVVLAGNLLALGEADLRAGRGEEADRRFHRALVLTRGKSTVDTRISVLAAAASRAWQRSELRLAEKYYKEALGLLKRGRSADRTRLASVLGGLGLLRLATGERASGASLLNESATILRETYGDDHLFAALASNNLLLAEISGVNGSIDISGVQQMVRVLRRDLGPMHPFLAKVLSNVGLWYQGSGRPDLAYEVHRYAVEILRRIGSADDQPMGRALVNLATSLIAVGELDQAEERLNQGLGILESRLGADHPDVVLARSNLSTIRGRRQDGGSAVSHRRVGEESHAAGAAPGETREASDVAARVYGHQAPVSLSARRRLAESLQDAGRHDEAIAEWEALLAHHRSAQPDSRDVVHLLHNLGFTLLSVGRTEDALAAYRDALDIARRTLPTSDADVALSLQNLGQALFEVNRCAEAQPILREHLQVQENRLGKSHRDLAVPLNALAQCATKIGDNGDAVRLSRRAATLGDGERDPPDLSALVIAAEAHNQAGDLAAAEAAYRDVLQRLVDPTPHVQTLRLQALIQLSGILNKDGRSQEALGLIEEALATAVAIRSPQWTKAIILANLAGTESEIGRRRQADEHFREALALAEASAGDRKAPPWLLERLSKAYAEFQRNR